MTALSSIIERVSAATGKDRALDVAIATTTEPDRYRSETDISWATDHGLVWEYEPNGNHRLTDAPRYTASLDAVVQLVERELPKLDNNRVMLEGWAGEPRWIAVVNREHVGSAPTPTLALLLAFLRAKSSIIESEAT